MKEERRQRQRRPRPPEPVLLGGRRNPGETATQGLLSVGEVPLPLPPLGAPPLPQEEGAVLASGLHTLPISDAPAERGEGQANARVVPVRPEPPSTVLSYLLKHLPVSLGLGPARLHSFRELQYGKAWLPINITIHILLQHNNKNSVCDRYRCSVTLLLQYHISILSKRA